MSSGFRVSDSTIETAAAGMHDAYENAATANGWETNPASRKPWADVPEANKATMRAALAAALPSLVAEIREQIASKIDNHGRAWCTDYGRGCHHSICNARRADARVARGDAG
jgi:hypothetical protein